MRAEEELQFMMDFYPELFPTRNHCLNQLFCVFGNGYEWRNGELVDEDCEFEKRYRLAGEIVKARPRNEKEYQLRLEVEKEIRKAKGDSYRITPQNVKYNFQWSTPSKEYSYIYHYPKDIKSDWLALLRECERQLMEEGIIQDSNGMKGSQRDEGRQEKETEELHHMSGLSL